MSKKGIAGEISFRLEYLLLRILEFILSTIPRSLALRLGTLLGSLLYATGFYRLTVRRNMEHTGIWGDAEMDRIIKDLYHNIGRYAVDFLRSSPEQLPHRIHNSEILQSVLKEDKGALVLLAHMGNWEMLAGVYGRLLADLNVVAKPMKNELVDRWLAKKRQRASVKTIYTRNAIRKMLEVIKHKGFIAILIDQHAGKHGTMVPFLGKMANTVKAVAGIAQKTGCVVLTIYAVMLKDGSYDVVLQRAPSPGEEINGEQERIEEYLKLHNEVISDWVRRYPEHYFGWFHKRFRGVIKYS